MSKMSLTRALVVAGALAVVGAGAAQADTIFYPDGTTAELGNTGADNLALVQRRQFDGHGHLVLQIPRCWARARRRRPTTTVTTEQPLRYVYVQPNIDWDRDTAIRQMHHNAHLLHRQAMSLNRTGATALNSGDAVVVGSYTIPYSSVVAGDPYYVFSY